MVNAPLVWSSHSYLTKGMSKGTRCDRNAETYQYVNSAERVKTSGKDCNSAECAAMCYQTRMKHKHEEATCEATLPQLHSQTLCWRAMPQPNFQVIMLTGVVLCFFLYAFQPGITAQQTFNAHFAYTKTLSRHTQLPLSQLVCQKIQFTNSSDHKIFTSDPEHWTHGDCLCGT